MAVAMNRLRGIPQRARLTALRALPAARALRMLRTLSVPRALLGLRALLPLGVHPALRAHPAPRTLRPPRALPALRALLLLLVLSALALAPVAAGAAPAAPLKNAVLISWDGVQREHLYELLAAGRLPHLQALVEEGTLVDIDVTAHQTDTKAGHAQMLTGYGPKVTGVFNNQRYRPIPRGLTIFERLEKELGEDKIATIMITGKAGNLGSRGCSSREGEPFYHTRLALDLFQGDKARQADEVGRLALKSLDCYGRERFFAFFHFSDPDSAGHRYGENSPQYEAAIVEADRWLGQIVEKLKSLGVYEETRIYVTSDHGFDEGQTTHRQAPRVFLATNDREVKRGGDQGELAPTILSRMGLDPARMTPPFPGRPLTEPAQPAEGATSAAEQADGQQG